MLYQDMSIPILTIRLELIEKKVALRPPLDENSSQESVQETVQHWLNSFLARGFLVDMLGGKVCYLHASTTATSHLANASFVYIAYKILLSFKGFPICYVIL